MSTTMDHPFAKSVSSKEKIKRLLEIVSHEETLGIVINADPDAMASALALKRMFWRKAGKVEIYNTNTIQRADNLTFIKLLRMDQKHIRHMKVSGIDRWAMVDSQPAHYEQFRNRRFDIIIDHHPLDPSTKALFVDVKADYGANATIMTEYLRAAGIRPAPMLATALFYGIKTDTDNFVRESLPNDINAFRYLYRFTNMNIIKKIESSEMTKKTLASYRIAMERLKLLKNVAFVHMGNVDNPDILVIIADFFMKFAEARWSVVSGIYGKNLIVILRNAGFRGDAGKTALRLFGRWGGSAGGHKGAARAEIPLKGLPKEAGGGSHLSRFVLKILGEI